MVDITIGLRAAKYERGAAHATERHRPSCIDDVPVMKLTCARGEASHAPGGLAHPAPSPDAARPTGRPSPDTAPSRGGALRSP